MDGTLSERRIVFERLKNQRERFAIPLDGTPPSRGDACSAGMLLASLPAGGIVTLEGHGTAGRASVAARLLADATQRGLAAFLDPVLPDALSLADAGVDLTRLVLLATGGIDRLTAARALDAVLRSQVCGTVVIADAPRFTSAVWLRIARLAEAARTLTLVIEERARPELAAAAAARLGCALERVRWTAESGPLGSLLGYDVRLSVLRHHRLSTSLSAGLSCTLADPLAERLSARTLELPTPHVTRTAAAPDAPHVAAS